MNATATTDAFRVWFRLIRLESRIRGAVAERLRSVDLSVPQCDVLTTLSEREGVSQQDLAERLYVTKGNISGLVDRLAAAGLVERRDLPSDRRSHAIYLTSAGRTAAERGIVIQRAFVAQTLGQMSEQELAAFDAQLGRARDLVREATAAASGADPDAKAARARAARPERAPRQPRSRSTKAGKSETSSRT
jgi:DNA-binding MarR family transcriptional regulator